MPWIRKRERTAVKEERRTNTKTNLHAQCVNCGQLVTLGWKVGEPDKASMYHTVTGTRACEPDQVLPGLYLEPSDNEMWNTKRAEV